MRTSVPNSLAGLLFELLCPHGISLSPAVSGSIPNSQQANSLEMDGGLVNNGAMVAALRALQINGAPASGSCKYSTSAGATITLTDIAGLTQTLSNGGAVTVTIDSAYNIVNTIPGAFNGMTFPMTIATAAATTVATPTVTLTGVTLAGTTSVLAASARWYQGQITQLYAGSAQAQSLTAGTTFTSLAQVSTTNKYTLTIAGNSVVTTVGNVIYIGVTTGTLPPGWYEIVGASATVPTIVAPVQATAFTATAASMVQPAFTNPVYAPLLTITGMFAGVVSTMSL